MNYSSEDIKKLLDLIEKKTGYGATYSDSPLAKAELDKLYYALNPERKEIGFADLYLYRYLYKPIYLHDKKTVSVHSSVINEIAKALGYENYKHFLRVSNLSDNRVLKAAMGIWYSYVRCNSGQEYILRSPVRIFEERKEVRMELKGPVRYFKGQVHVTAECFHCHLRSSMNKNIYLVFKAGFAERPEVLQGVFSGLSTAGDPIGGREILIRQPPETEFADLTNARVPIGELTQSKDREEQLIGKYFFNKDTNILKGGRASTFGFDDLAIE